MIVVDTNVLVYLMIQGDHTEEALKLFARDPDWHSESFILTEFTNVLATYLRSQLLHRVQAERLLREAQAQLTDLVNVPHLHALRVSDEFGISSYDARFVAAARDLNKKLITEDLKLRRAVPRLTISLAEWLSA